VAQEPDRTGLEAVEELARAREHLWLFAGQVGHDLRTPLTAVLANAEMLAAEPAVSADEELAWMVDGITRAAHRMNKMIEEMLGYARGGGVPSIEVAALDDVVRAALHDLAPVVAATGAEVVVDPLPTLRADPAQLGCVVRNLLANAVKFARPGMPPRVRVGAERLDDGCWRVSVTDDGVGVDPERQEAMFVLFARADKRVEGRGIGLAAARRIIEAHGGRIGMESGPDGGTTVWFELPA
jgi:signal transduction histidine kinase